MAVLTKRKIIFTLSLMLVAACFFLMWSQREVTISIPYEMEYIEFNGKKTAPEKVLPRLKKRTLWLKKLNVVHQSKALAEGEDEILAPIYDFCMEHNIEVQVEIPSSGYKHYHFEKY